MPLGRRLQKSRKRERPPRPPAEETALQKGIALRELIAHGRGPPQRHRDDPLHESKRQARDLDTAVVLVVARSLRPSDELPLAGRLDRALALQLVAPVVAVLRLDPAVLAGHAASRLVFRDGALKLDGERYARVRGSAPGRKFKPSNCLNARYSRVGLVFRQAACS
jgi:hypothetical protein